MADNAELVTPRVASDLRPGDVVFWHSRNPWALLIQRIDGTRWNHASIVIGDAGDEVLHAESEKRGVALDVVSMVRILKPGRTAVVRPRPGSPDLGVKAAGAVGKYTGRAYALHTLVLLAGVLWTRRSKVSWWLGNVLAWLARLGGKRSLICSELVRRAWRDAGVDLCPEAPDTTTPGDLWRAFVLHRFTPPPRPTKIEHK